MEWKYYYFSFAEANALPNFQDNRHQKIFIAVLYRVNCLISLFID